MLKLRQGKEKYMDMNKCKGMCTCSMVGKILLIIGGLNWGLVGIGMLIGSNLNVVSMIFGTIPTLEAVIYILVGVAAVMKIFTCKCRKCTEANTACCGTGKMEEKA